MSDREEIKKKVLEYLTKVDKAKNKDVAKALGEVKRDCDKAIGELAREGKIEYLYIGTSYITLKK